MVWLSGTDTDVDRCVRQIAGGLHQRLGELTAAIQRLLQDEIPELALDAQSIELLGASVGGNVDTVLHAMRYGIRRAARRGADRGDGVRPAVGRSMECPCTDWCVPTGSVNGV